MKDVKFLDCTLRDGAHVVGGEFQRDRILDILDKLTKAKVDIIEFGFLKMCDYDRDKVYYPYIENAYDVLEQMQQSSESRSEERRVLNLQEKPWRRDIFVH